MSYWYSLPIIPSSSSNSPSASLYCPSIYPCLISSSLDLLDLGLHEPSHQDADTTWMATIALSQGFREILS